MLIRLAGSLLSSRGATARLVILTHHRVLKRKDPLLPGEVDEQGFENQLASLSRHFNVLALSDAASRLREGRLPPRSLVISFDDGYRDNNEVALPQLVKYGLPATFFIASGFLDGGTMWNDMIIETVRCRAGSDLDLSGIGLGCHPLTSPDEQLGTINTLVNRLKYEPMHKRLDLVLGISDKAGCRLPCDLMMSSGQVADISRQGMEIGGHTLNHPILSSIGAQEAEKEIHEGRRLLEEITGGKITAFAYPNGLPGRDFRREHVDLLSRLGFKYGVTTSRGCATPASDLLQLPRIAPWGRANTVYIARVLRAYRQNQAEYL